MSSDDVILEMRGITKEFPGVRALDRVDISVRKGEVHALVGENGAGKSTLIKILSGVYQKDRGEIIFDGRTVDIPNPRASRALGISFIYQERNLVPFFTVSQNMFLGREPRRGGGRGWLVDTRAMDAAARKVLAELDADIEPTVIVDRLSVAQQQLVEVAKAMSQNAKMMVLDEPTAPLSKAEVAKLFRVIRGLSSRGLSVVYISHRLDEIFEVCNRVTVLRDGRVVGVEETKGLTSDKIVQMMVGREIRDRYPKRKVAIGETVLSVRDLTVRGVVHGVSFDVHAGETVGITGLVGSGKTELARAIFGADRADAGSVRVGQEDMRMGNVAAAVKAGIALAPEDRRRDGLVLSRSVKENVSLPSISSYSMLGFISRGRELKKAKELVSRLRIKTPSPFQRVRYLSGGNQQKVVLGKWMPTNSKVYVFDEPTTGIDVGSKVEFYTLMGELAAAGAGMILISPELPEILGMCDRILVMRGGRVVREFRADEVTAEQILSAALTGT